MDKILKWQTNRYNLIVKKFHLPKLDQFATYVDDAMSIESVDSVAYQEPEEELTFLEKVGMRVDLQAKENLKKPLFSEVANLIRKQNKIQKASRYYIKKFGFTTERIRRKIASSLFFKKPQVIKRVAENEIENTSTRRKSAEPVNPYDKFR